MSSQQTKENLIEVAIAAFARDGFGKTSLRSIAKEADVSPALVVHHFGSREQLIEQCIMRGLGLWVAEKQGFMDVSLSTALNQWQKSIEHHGQKLQFFRQVLVAGGEPANILFSRMVAEAEVMIAGEIEKGRMKQPESIPDLALLMTLHGLAPLVLQEQVNAHLGSAFTDPDNSRRLAAASLSIYANSVYKTTDKSKKKKKKAGKK